MSFGVYKTRLRTLLTKCHTPCQNQVAEEARVAVLVTQVLRVSSSEKGEHQERTLFPSCTGVANTATEERTFTRSVFRSVGLPDAVSGKVLELIDTTGSTVVVDVALAHSFESMFAERFCHAR